MSSRPPSYTKSSPLQTTKQPQIFVCNTFWSQPNQNRPNKLPKLNHSVQNYLRPDSTDTDILTLFLTDMGDLAYHVAHYNKTKTYADFAIPYIKNYLHSYHTHPNDTVLTTNLSTKRKGGAQPAPAADRFHKGFAILTCWHILYGPDKHPDHRNATLQDVKHNENPDIFQTLTTKLFRFFINRIDSRHLLSLHHLAQGKPANWERNLVQKLATSQKKRESICWSNEYAQQQYLNRDIDDWAMCKGIMFQHAQALCQVSPTFYNAIVKANGTFYLTTKQLKPNPWKAAHNNAFYMQPKPTPLQNIPTQT